MRRTTPPCCAWIILGDLAQEVAGDVPASQAAGYFKPARDAYESALRLRPNDANLKAAAQFAREQQQQAAERTAQTRRQAAGAYLSARRRELTVPAAGPTLRIYSAPGATAGTPYSYQPYTTPAGEPYTDQQYSSEHFSPADVPVRSNHPISATQRGAMVKPAAAAAPP
jgi:hypothetical protein